MRRTLIASLLLAFSLAAVAENAPKIKNMSRNFGPIGGGTALTINGNNLLTDVQCLLPCPTTVTFGDAPARLKGELRTMLHVATPPHAPGTVDVTISIAGYEPIVLANAYTYTTNAEASFEQVLLPIHFDGVLHGAHGSEWTTSLWIRNNGSSPVTIAPWACSEACPPVIPWTHSIESNRSLRDLAPLDLSDGNPSRVLYLSQAESADVSFSLRFADRSRGLIDAGIDLPVIRESESLYAAAQLFSVPLRPEFRVLLRLYELGDNSSRFRVTIYAQSERDDEPAIHSQELTATVPQGPFREKAGYAQLDLTGLLQLEKAWPENARIQIEPLTADSHFWAFASVTNNDTQIVTLVTPQ